MTPIDFAKIMEDVDRRLSTEGLRVAFRFKVYKGKQIVRISAEIFKPHQFEGYAVKCEIPYSMITREPTEFAYALHRMAAEIIRRVRSDFQGVHFNRRPINPDNSLRDTFAYINARIKESKEAPQSAITKPLKPDLPAVSGNYLPDNPSSTALIAGPSKP